MYPVVTSIHRTVRSLLAGGAAILMAACGQPEAERDLAAIQASDTLIVGTLYNSTSYFLYRGAAMGYEYELLREFAEQNDIEIRMAVAQDHDALEELLHSGRIDVAAARL